MTESSVPDWTRIDEVPRLLGALYAVVDELQAIFPGRKFTPDGHLVGSIGEVLAAYTFDIALNKASVTGHDGLLRELRVEVKAVGDDAKKVGIASHDVHPDHLLVFRLVREGCPIVLYNGKAGPVWGGASAPRSNGRRETGISALKALDATVPDHDRLEEVRPLADIGWAVAEAKGE